MTIKKLETKITANPQNPLNGRVVHVTYKVEGEERKRYVNTGANEDVIDAIARDLARELINPIVHKEILDDMQYVFITSDNKEINVTAI